MKLFGGTASDLRRTRERKCVLSAGFTNRRRLALLVNGRSSLNVLAVLGHVCTRRAAAGSSIDAAIAAVAFGRSPNDRT